jgi:GTPase SAR1 family protein
MKIVLLGDSGVGKTTLINMFTTGKGAANATVATEF